MDTVKLDEYLQSPCMASSLPYWKAQKTVVPDNMMIIRDNGFFKKITVSQLSQLWELQLAYKSEIGEDAPTAQDLARLQAAMERNQIVFYGAWDGETLVGCCSVTVGFSTFLYAPSGVFEDFYIRPEYRHQGIARALVQFAREDSGVSSLTVGCADCDLPMYQALGFSIPLGNLLAFDA